MNHHLTEEELTILNPAREEVGERVRADLGEQFATERNRQIDDNCGSITNVRRIVAAAERLDRATKQPGRGGLLGRPALAVLRALAEVIDYGTGRLCPSWAWLEARTGYCHDSVWRALRRLHQAGLVAWIGRYQPTGLGRERGPQVAQTSSAYALRLPPELAAIVATMPSTEALAREAARRRQEARAGRLASWREALARTTPATGWRPQLEARIAALEAGIATSRVPSSPGARRS